jgi:hypothetical protein
MLNETQVTRTNDNKVRIDLTLQTSEREKPTCMVDRILVTLYIGNGATSMARLLPPSVIRRTIKLVLQFNSHTWHASTLSLIIGTKLDELCCCNKVNYCCFIAVLFLKFLKARPLLQQRDWLDRILGRLSTLLQLYVGGVLLWQHRDGIVVATLLIVYCCGNETVGVVVATYFWNMW